MADDTRTPDTSLSGEISASEFVAQYGSVRQSKYRAVPTVVDGIRFDSKAEARRYEELKMLEEGGAIRDLALQQRFDLTVNGKKIGTYVADFVYTDNATGQVAVEDVKGMKTPLYIWKAKHFAAQYGFPIVEVRS